MVECHCVGLAKDTAGRDRQKEGEYKMKKKILALILSMALCFSIAACGSEGSTQTGSDTSTEETEENQAEEGGTEAGGESDLAYVQDKGTLIVGITDFEPMDYKDSSGDWIGFDADMARVLV